MPGNRHHGSGHAALHRIGPLLAKPWFEHQTRDDFWKHGSICEDWSKVTVPVYAVSGWADGYCRTVFRLMEYLRGPKKGLVGPWAHKYPDIGESGPAIHST